MALHACSWCVVAWASAVVPRVLVEMEGQSWLLVLRHEVLPHRAMAMTLLRSTSWSVEGTVAVRKLAMDGRLGRSYQAGLCHRLAAAPTKGVRHCEMQRRQQLLLRRQPQQLWSPWETAMDQKLLLPCRQQRRWQGDGCYSPAAESGNQWD